MPPRFSEILDSEDEDDLVAVRAPSVVATFTSGEGAAVDLDVDASSASTAEQLRRAHLALMAPTQEDAPVVNFSDLAATSAASSPSSTHKKRSLIDTDPEPRSSGKLKRIKNVTKSSFQDPHPDLIIPPPILPFDGTSDTIPGPTLPSLTGHDMLNEKRTPNPRRRKSSQHQSSSADQNSLTPWSGTALGSSDKFNSDDAAVGLPKEMYQPRPSRSRSAQVDNSHLDFTQVVEKAVKKSRPKRSITDTAENVTSAPMFPKHPIDQAPPFERLSPSPESPAFEQSMQLDSTVPESLQDHPSSSKSSKSTKKAATTKPPTKRGRPKKHVIEDEEDELAQEEEIPVARQKTPKSASRTEVQVVIDSRPDPALAATVLAQLRQHKSREPTPKPPLDPVFEPLQSEHPNVKTEPEHEAEVEDDSEDEIAKPRSTARTKAKAKPKAKAKSPEPVYKEEDDPKHEDEEEFVEEVIKSKTKTKAKAKAKPKARGKTAKAVVALDPPSDHEEDVPEPLPTVEDDEDSEADHISEAEEDSEEESPKPKSKAKAKAKAEPKSKAKPKAKAATPKPAAATPKPSPEAEAPKPAVAEAPTPAAVVTPKFAAVNKDAKSSAKPSWQQSTYRVGLSKTQRIPSLLKVFKK